MAQSLLTGDACRAAEEYAEAASHYERGLALEESLSLEERAELRWKLAMCQRELGRPDDAESTLRFTEDELAALSQLASARVRSLTG